MKKVIFVSTGRCGTKRIYEIFKNKKLDGEVKHQMPFSRLANIMGNIMFIFGSIESVKTKLYSFIVSEFLKKKIFYL